VKYLLDTNTCIRVLNASGTATLVERWKGARPSQIRLCSVVKAELLFGAEKSSKRELVRQKLQIFFSRFKSMPFDDKAAQTYGSSARRSRRRAARSARTTCSSPPSHWPMD